MEKSTFNCHICGQPFNIVPGQGKGVMLRCDNKEGCLPHENVYGFGSNEKEAAQIAKEKYRV